jgi:hypothetical protein
VRWKKNYQALLGPDLPRQTYTLLADLAASLQITCDDARAVPVPGRQYTFGVVQAAQAREDFVEALV